MVSDLPQDMELQHTMTHLEELRRKSSGGAEFWFARKIQGVLGYAEWRNFEKVIDRARSSMKTNGVPPSHHIVEVNKMVGAGKGGRPNERDFFLSRAACYLIAMNGDPTKLEIAAAQAYFAVQTRAREIESTLTEDEKRLELREKVKKSFKAVSGAAKEAGVANSKQPIFHNASVPSMMQDSQTLDYVRFSGYENTSMHMAVSRGSGAIGTADRGPEHAAEGGLALADRASVGGGMRHHGDHAAHRDIKADGVALAGALPGGRGRWPVARQEPAAGDAAAERRHQDAGG